MGHSQGGLPDGQKRLSDVADQAQEISWGTGRIHYGKKWLRGDIIQKVDDLLNKRKMKTNEEAQTLEDVVCLVFLNYYFDDFITKHDEEKLIDIVRKPWNKMSEKGHQAALEMFYSDAALAIVKKALD
jgi:hypothetical protein